MNCAKGTIHATHGGDHLDKKNDIRNALNIINPNLSLLETENAVTKLSVVPTSMRDMYAMMIFATSLKGKDAIWHECCWKCGTPVGYETFEDFEKRLKNDNYCKKCGKYRSRFLNRLRAGIKGNPQF